MNERQLAQDVVLSCYMTVVTYTSAVIWRVSFCVVLSAPTATIMWMFGAR